MINIRNLKLLLTVLFLFTASLVSAQIPVSKSVQKYANKKMFEKEERQRKPSIRTVARPPITISKGVHSRAGDSELAKGNMISTGYPYWALAKGVNRYHLNADFREAYVAGKKRKNKE
jgi:hypothetical protein